MVRTGYFRAVPLVAAMMAAAVVAVMVGYGSASAQVNTEAVITVNTMEDNIDNDGKCSLREAIENVNANASVFPDCQAGSATDEDTIVFSEEVKGETITLDPAQGQLSVSDQAGLVIDGGKEKGVTISGGGNMRVFQNLTSATLEVKHLTVADGSAANNFGGGILNNDGTLTVTNSTFSNNSAANGLGGGIFNQSGTLEVTNSTFSENSANFGGGIVSTGTLTVTNSTFSNNSATNNGGGIFDNGGTTTVSNSTFSQNNANTNNGGGIFTNGTTTLRSTIVAKSQGGDCSGAITDEGYNIDTDGSCVQNAKGSKTTNPKLDSKGLQNNGGPTQTLALLKGSPALNAIPKSKNGCGTEIKTDQRGVKRPQGKQCDIGAYEKKVRSR